MFRKCAENFLKEVGNFQFELIFWTRQVAQNMNLKWNISMWMFDGCMLVCGLTMLGRHSRMYSPPSGVSYVSAVLSFLYFLCNFNQLIEVPSMYSPPLGVSKREQLQLNIAEILNWRPSMSSPPLRTSVSLTS